ncbi:transmembrane alpha-helix domain protein [Fusarium beomiforme]|uniref:Transmembrane alpha-helix domain protein n=1 Tax=Fusarium beomiforme TaxID=44412 RepID=A0A9P5AAU1_9HYPO|nr:transmembrane alpha-helix domain protein [Fusarium beomiforme]
MVHLTKTAFCLISAFNYAQGFLNDLGNRPPLAGKRTHRGCYRGLSDTVDPIVQVKGDDTKNTWTACGQYCLDKGKPMALVQGSDCYCSETIPNQRLSVGGFGHYCMDPCPGKPTDLVACGSEIFGSYSAINTGLKTELWPDQDGSPDDPTPECLGCTFKLPADAVFHGKASGVHSCRTACRVLKSKALMIYDKKCFCTNATVSQHSLVRVPEEMCSYRWARKPCGGYSYTLRSPLFSVYDATRPEKPGSESAPDATTSQDAASPADTQQAKVAAQTLGLSVGEITERLETEVQLQMLMLESDVWNLFAWLGRVMTSWVTPREGTVDGDRELDLQK